MAKYDRLNKQIQYLTADLLFREIKDPSLGLVSITRVELSPDRRYCKLFVSILGKPSQQRTSMRALARARGFIQSKVAAKLALRYAPILSFEQDPSIEKGVQMAKLIDQVIAGEKISEASEETEE